MKTFWQLILELTAYQKLERDSWKKVAKRTVKPTVAKRETLPWMSAGDRLHGWWHGKKTPIEFRWSWGQTGGNYHVTQIVRHPEAFGITKADIMRECDKFAKLRPDSYIYRRDPATGEVETRRKDGERIYHELKTGEKDIMGLLEALVLEKGWVKVAASNHSISLEGIDKYVMKDVVREIRAAGNDDPIVAVIHNLISPVDGYRGGRGVTLKTEQETERFLNS